MTQLEPAALHAACRRVVAVVNGKGGVLKTTTAANLAGQAADAGHSVLLVDLDPQANLSEDLGITQNGAGADGGAALFDAIARGKELVPSHPGIRDRLDLVAADPMNTAALVAWLAAHRDPGGVLALARALAPIAPRYDLVVIDLPPVLEELRRIALAAARYLVIPTQSDISSLKGMRLIAQQFAQARQVNPDLELLGILLVLVPESARAIRDDVTASIHADFGGNAPVFRTVIRHALAPARDARKRGLLAHELETFVPSQAETFARLRQRAAGATVERAVSSTAVKVAADWAGFTEETLMRIAEREAERSGEGGAER
ncbi:ParA family protein [Kribbella sp. CA-247076]|uniref:ParA family protein n=1 Tax=Kribbella sp. CA-247076 TaxID=3239941 RepID=UPI003D90BAF2